MKMPAFFFLRHAFENAGNAERVSGPRYGATSTGDVLMLIVLPEMDCVLPAR